MQIRIAVPDLDSLGDDERMIASAYEAQQGGGYRLHPDVAAYVRQCEAELSDLQWQHSESLAEKERRIDAKSRYIVEERKRAAVEAALSKHGAAKRTLAGATALILAEHTFIIEGDSILIENRYGRRSVDEAVASWIASDEGIPFREARAAESGEFLALLRR
jgi:hypothetical protein